MDIKQIIADLDNEIALLNQVSPPRLIFYLQSVQQGWDPRKAS